MSFGSLCWPQPSLQGAVAASVVRGRRRGRSLTEVVACRLSPVRSACRLLPVRPLEVCLLSAFACRPSTTRATPPWRVAVGLRQSRSMGSPRCVSAVACPLGVSAFASPLGESAVASPPLGGDLSCRLSPVGPQSDWCSQLCHSTPHAAHLLGWCLGPAPSPATALACPALSCAASAFPGGRHVTDGCWVAAHL